MAYTFDCSTAVFQKKGVDATQTTPRWSEADARNIQMQM
jgi:hypothetical protein